MAGDIQGNVNRSSTALFQHLDAGAVCRVDEAVLDQLTGQLHLNMGQESCRRRQEARGRRPDARGRKRGRRQTRLKGQELGAREEGSREVEDSLRGR